MALYPVFKNNEQVHLCRVKVLFHLLRLDFHYDLHLPFNLTIKTQKAQDAIRMQVDVLIK